MKIERIPGANLDLVGSRELSEEHPETEIVSLPVIYTGRSFTSQWRPTPAELAKIAAGAPIRLSILSEWHPPVMITVGPIPGCEEKVGQSEH